MGIVDECSKISTINLMSENCLNSFNKNLNVTFSFLFHYFTETNTYPKCLIIYADNCGATNKNNYILFFFHYLIHKLKFFEEVELCFLLPGHTKFTPD